MTTAPAVTASVVICAYTTDGRAHLVAAVDPVPARDRPAVETVRHRRWSEGLSTAAVARLVGGTDGLSTERDHVAVMLPRAVLSKLRRDLRGTLGA